MSEFTKNDMDLLEQRITANVLAGVQAKIETEFEKHEARLIAGMSKDFAFFKEILDQHKEWHKKHFEKTDTIRETQSKNKEVLEAQITDSRISTIREISRENEKQDELISKLSDRITTIESEARGRHSQLLTIISIVGVLLSAVMLALRFIPTPG